MARCFYCLQDRPLTLAHLFQKRIREALPLDELGVNLGSASAQILGVERAISHGGDFRDAKVRALCAECNSKWMQRIEIAAGSGFETLVADGRLPAPPELLSVAHWAVVLSMLASELHPLLEIPEGDRAVVRAAPGLPLGYATFFVLTDYSHQGAQTDLFRVVNEDNSIDVQWYHLLHAGRVVMLSCSPMLVGVIARELFAAEIHSFLCFIGENKVYVPTAFASSMRDLDLPSHQRVHDLAPRLIGGAAQYIKASNETDLLDLSGGPAFGPGTRFSFDFADRVFDVGDLPIEG